MVVNPARAGMIRFTARITESCDRKPRASGDDPAIAGINAKMAE